MAIEITTCWVVENWDTGSWAHHYDATCQSLAEAEDRMAELVKIRPKTKFRIVRVETTITPIKESEKE